LYNSHHSFGTQAITRDRVELKVANQITAAQLGIDYAMTVVILWGIAIGLSWRSIYRSADEARCSSREKRGKFLILTGIAFPVCLLVSIIPTLLFNG